MRKPALLIFANFAILIVVFAMLTQALFVVQRVAVTESLSGNVGVQRNGQGNFQLLSQNDFVKVTDVVRADKDGMAEFKWSDGTRLRVTPNTQLTIDKVSYNALQKADSSHFKLVSGKVFVRLVKSLPADSSFEVETPTTLASVRGTIFSVEVKDGKTEVAVYKGSVKISSKGKERQEKVIAPGEIAVSSQPDDLKAMKSDAEIAEFEAQPSIIKPELAVEIEANQDGGSAMLAGRTEAGDAVTINEKPAIVLGNGVFRHRVKLQPGQNQFIITSTDKHGATASITKTVQSSKK